MKKRSKSGEDVVDSDPNFQIGVFAQRADVLFDRIPSATLVESLSDVPFNFDADLANVSHRFLRGRYDHVEGLF